MNPGRPLDRNGSSIVSVAGPNRPSSRCATSGRPPNGHERPVPDKRRVARDVGVEQRHQLRDVATRARSDEPLRQQTRRGTSRSGRLRRRSASTLHRAPGPARELPARGRRAPHDLSTASNEKPNTSCSTNAVRSAGDSRSSTTESAAAPDRRASPDRRGRSHARPAAASEPSGTSSPATDSRRWCAERSRSRHSRRTTTASHPRTSSSSSSSTAATGRTPPGSRPRPRPIAEHATGESDQVGVVVAPDLVEPRGRGRAVGVRIQVHRWLPGRR